MNDLNVDPDLLCIILEDALVLLVVVSSLEMVVDGSYRAYICVGWKKSANFSL